ncbi:MAG: DNA topoisomerase IV subunit A, partial [Aliidongia sp.]
KQVMNPAEGAVARWCLPLSGDALGLLGENRKLLVLPVTEIPDMVRGRGVILQKYRDGGLGDVRMLTLAQGLSWQSGTRTRSEPDLSGWQTGRGSSGRMAPTGFPQKPVRFP